MQSKPIGGIEPAQRILFWALFFALSPPAGQPVDDYLRIILAPSGGHGGEPGWEIDHIPECEGQAGGYRVWVDPEVSGYTDNERLFSVETFRRAVAVSLRALAIRRPERSQEVLRVLKDYGFEAV